MATTQSFSVIIPKSPWLASPGWIKNAGVPVEASVAAILLPTCPDFPMPVMITLPSVFCITSSALVRLPFKLFSIMRRASISLSIVCFADMISGFSLFSIVFFLIYCL